MKKSIKRMLSVLLAMVMLLGMTASAQVQRISFDLAAANGLKLDGILSMGFDQDGCEQYTFENSMLGKWVLQSDGLSLVAGGDQVGYYAISADDLSTALTNVISTIISNEMGEEFFAVMNYVNSPSFEADAGVAVQIIANEANRIASLAQSMGLVKIHENGDLEINAETKDLFILIANYLNSLADDTAVLNAFASLEIFGVMGVDMAANVDQLPAMLKNAAANFESILDDLGNVKEGGFKLYVAALTGVVSGEYYTVNKHNGEVINSVTQKFAFSEQFYSVESVTEANGGVVTQKVAYSLVAPYSYINSISAVYGDQKAEASLTIDQNGLNFNFDANTDELTGKGKIVADSYGVKGDWDLNGAVTLNGKIDFNAAESECIFKLNYALGNNSVKMNCEYADGELYSEYVAIENGKTVANWTITGSNTYRVNGSWSDYAGSYSLSATLRMKNNGPELEGTYQAASNYGSSSSCEFLYSADKVNDASELVITMTEGKIKRHVEIRSSETGAVENVSLVYYIDNGRNVSKLEAACAIDTIKDTISGTFMVKENDYSDAIEGTFYWDASLIEAKWTDGQMNYRVYAEAKKDYSDIKVTAGLSGYQLSNPENVMDAILFVLNANINSGLTFDAVLNTMMGYFASAAFDGQKFQVEVTDNGSSVVFEAQMVNDGNVQYLAISGAVEGTPITAAIGTVMKDNGVMCFFVEINVDGQSVVKNEINLIPTENGYEIEVSGDQIVIDGLKATLKAGLAMESEETILFYAEAIAETGEKVGAYLPVTFVETRGKIALSGDLYVTSGAQRMDLGTLNVSYEETSEKLEHVAGTPLTAGDLTNLLLSVLEGLSY